MSHSVSPSVRNRRFHIDKGFDFERFINSMYGFTSPIIPDEYLRITTMFIYQDDAGRPYGQYRLPKDLCEHPGFEDEADFLSKHKLYLDENENEQFSIKRIYDAFYTRPDKDKILDELKPFNLSEYFQTLPQGAITDAREIDFGKPPHDAHTTENFLQAELVLVHTLVEELNTSSGYYWPLPIIAFGDLVGMMYFVYDQEKLRGANVKDVSVYKRLFILTVTREFEKIVLDKKFTRFAEKPEDPLEDYREVFADLKISDYVFFNPISKPRSVISHNSFLKDLGYDSYYSKFGKVYASEANLALKAHEAMIRSAIISIIVDSFAHNVGAHSLIAMKWYEENRFKILDKQIDLIENGKGVELIIEHKISSDDLKEYAQPDIFYEEMNRSESAQSKDQVSLIDVFRKMNADRQNHILRFKNKNTGTELAQVPIPLNSAYHYYEFLRNKSAFWSGVTRDTVFSGRLRSWFNLIRDFLCNSLFLGTIAHSEDINRIHFFLEIIGPDGAIQHTGKFAEINLNIIKHERFDEDYQAPDRQPGEFSDYAFLRAGEQYEELSEALRELDTVFLPSEMVGQQAFYTLLENTLRNIKHYHRYLEEIKIEGIRFYLSIQEVGLVRRGGKGAPTKEKKLYKVGTWLHHEQDMVGPFYHAETKETSEISVIDQHTRQLKQRIVGPHGRVRLGGSSQDKVCAAMLLNNTFDSIEGRSAQHTKRHYYPYVIPASEPYRPAREARQPVQDDILHMIYNKNIRAETSAERKQKYEQEASVYRERLKTYRDKGIVKKYFHIWKGEDCKIIEKGFNSQNENLARFRIVAVDQYQPEGQQDPEKKDSDYSETFSQLRRQGIVRIIPADPYLKTRDEAARYKQAMAQWLHFWLQDKKNKKESVGLRLLKQSGEEWQHIGLIELVQVHEHWQVNYHNEKQIQNKIKDPNDPFSQESLEDFDPLKLVHGTSDTESSGVSCRIRSHCSLMNYVYDPDHCTFARLNSVRGAHVKAGKMLETVLTRIVVFDNRMYSRISGTQHKGLDTHDNVFRDQLGLQVYPERPGRFMKNREHFLEDCHILVVHLSFLELIWKDEKNRVPYTEGEVKDFFEKEIQQFHRDTFKDAEGEPKNLPENFLLVITSGRGRGDWAQGILQHPQITFRPIEALVDAVEDGLTMKDDYQIKHNLCNLIFGS